MGNDFSIQLNLKKNYIMLLAIMGRAGMGPKNPKIRSPPSAPRFRRGSLECGTVCGELDQVPQEIGPTECSTSVLVCGGYRDEKWEAPAITFALYP